MEQLLQQHLPMIRKAAWRASKMWNQEYEEALSIAYEVFIETVGKYEERRGIQFGTYLYHRLRKVNEKCKSQHMKVKNEYCFGIPSKNEICIKLGKESAPKSMDHFADVRSIFKIFKERLEFYDCMETELSLNAKELLKWILENKHEKNRLSFHQTRKYFTQELKWRFKDLKQAWDEVQNWWNENNFAFS
jgi:DNA-directed RNA polymerase specialized sigma subunit